MRLSHTLAIGLLAVTGVASAQEPTKVRFESADGVDLQGLMWPGRGNTPPVVMLVHEIGEDSRRKPWRDLATALDQAGYAVLAFDLRGHGFSTEINADVFWSVPLNRTLIRGAGAADLDYKKFDKRYYPALVNDLAAAKAFLDRKNDALECNSGNVIVIGAGAGATLAAIWMQAEWHRYQYFPGGVFTAPSFAPKSEGENLLCGVFLDVSSALGARTLPLNSLLDVPGRQGKTPLMFLYNEDNARSRRVSESLDRSLKNKQELPYTGAVKVTGAGSLQGAALLQPSLGTTKGIVEYLDAVREAKAQDWIERDVRDSLYVWRVPRMGLQPLAANAAGDRTLQFNSYEGFIPLR